MRPITLTLSSWGPYKEVEWADFSTMQQGGLFLICGATGAGKTTIFDGITFALYGEVSGSVREKDSLRSDFALPSAATYVELVFTHKGEQYRLLRNPRYDRPKLRGEGVTTEAEGGELYCGEELLAAGSSQVTDKVKELLGLDYHQFKQISLIAQGEFQQLLVASSKERTQIFRDIFKTRLYDVMTSILVREVKRLSARVEEVKSRADEVTAAFRMNSEGWNEQKSKKNRNYGKMITLAEMEMEKAREEERLLADRLTELDSSCKSQIKKIENWKNGNLIVQQYEAALRNLEALQKEKGELGEQVKVLTIENKKIPVMQKRLDKEKEELSRMTEQKAALVEWQKKAEALTLRQTQYLRLDEDAKQKKADFEIQDDRYKKAAAGILARDLKPGLPCPVCGSTHHPELARVESKVPGEQELKQLKLAYESAWQEAAKAQEASAMLVGQLYMMEQSLKEILKDKDGKEALAKLEKAMKERDASIRLLSRQIMECQKQYQDSVVRLEKCKSSYTQLKAGIKAPAQKEPVDLSVPEAELADMERQRKSLLREKEGLKTAFTMNRQALGALKGHLEEKEKLEVSYSCIRELERAASGYNDRNLVLEQYVLSVYFDDILRAANTRLLAMTGERYELYRLPQSKDRRSKEGMEMEVLDQYTGKKRSVRSLSGGEAFKAALSLALGTSDVIQSYSGGTQVETLFVDEGFGSLDAESLDQAVGILAKLSGNNRMVGIISHVEELKEQIGNRILVEKTNQGSRILSDTMT